MYHFIRSRNVGSAEQDWFEAGSIEEPATEDAFEESSEEENLSLAYSFAAPEIKRRYPSAELFGQMVKNGYSDIWDSKSHTFEDLKLKGDIAYQIVTVFSDDNIINNYIYTLYNYYGEWVIPENTQRKN